MIGTLSKTSLLIKQIIEKQIEIVATEQVFDLEKQI